VLNIVLTIAAIVCAIQAIRAGRLLFSALWLAGTSAIIALLLYALGAPEVAAIELSVGAGLVTILFVFAISVAGDEAIPGGAVVPRPLAWGLIGLTVILMGWLVLKQPLAEVSTSTATSFTQMLWEQRGLDMLIQLVVIFSGVLGMVGVLSETTEDGRRTTDDGMHAGETSVDTGVHS
jgi:NADH:ubiquinone oxidoreductase subunit 6 (subunit J)